MKPQKFKTTGRPQKPRLNLEQLEERTVPTVTALLDAGHLILESDAASDLAVVHQYRVTPYTEYLQVFGSGVGLTLPLTAVHRISFYGNDGDDIFANNSSIFCYVNGGRGNDTLHGSSSDDIILGGRGDDVIYGRGGDDGLYGGYDNDLIHGEGGDDAVNGGDGNDVLFGDENNDTLYGLSGNDMLYGGSGSDLLEGGRGDDTLVSIDSSTSDILRGQSGFDSFWVDRNLTSNGWWWYFVSDSMDASTSETATNVHHIWMFANGADRTLDGDDIADPTDGSNYKNFADRPLFSEDGPVANDVDQGSLGDCWLMASMGSVAHTNQNAIYQTVVSLGDGTFAVRLGGSSYYRVDADLPTGSASSWTPTYAGLGVDDSLWVAIVEKAYAFHEEGTNTYSSLRGGLGVEGLPGLNATDVGDKYFHTYSNGQAILNDIRDRLDDGLAVTCGFDDVVSGPVSPYHEYTVIDVNRNIFGTVASVTLRNPHGPAGVDNHVTMTGAQLFASAGSIAWGDVGGSRSSGDSGGGTFRGRS